MGKIDLQDKTEHIQERSLILVNEVFDKIINFYKNNNSNLQL